VGSTWESGASRAPCLQEALRHVSQHHKQGRNTSRRTPTPRVRNGGATAFGQLPGPRARPRWEVCLGADDVRHQSGCDGVGGPAARGPGPGTVASPNPNPSPSPTDRGADGGGVREGVDHPASLGPSRDEGALRGPDADLHRGSSRPCPGHRPERGASAPVALPAGGAPRRRRRAAPRGVTRQGEAGQHRINVGRADPAKRRPTGCCGRRWPPR